MSSTIDFVSPYGAIAQRQKDGLDAILVSIGAGGPTTVTVDDLMDAVYAYLVSVYTTIGTNPQGEESVRATIANAINGYIQNGGASPYLRQLQSVPVTTLITKFDRMADAMVAAPVLKGNASRAQMVLAIGQADAEYWGAQIASAVNPWASYMFTNAAVNYSSVPYWTDAAMFGAHFDYYQVDATDSNASTSVIISALAGSLVVAAGKVVFGWVPKVGSKIRPVNPGKFGGIGLKPNGNIPSINGNTAREFGYSCYYQGNWVFGGVINSDSEAAAQATLNESAAESPGLSCTLHVA